MFLVGGLMLALAAYKMVEEWVNWDPEKAFRESHLAQLRSARDYPPASIGFARDDQTLAVTDSAAIVEFFDLLSSVQRVHAHHSHPVKVISFRSSALTHTYILGMDSAHPDEYWLEVPKIDQTGPTKNRRVVQFVSPELTAWLHKTKVETLQK